MFANLGSFYLASRFLKVSSGFFRNMVLSSFADIGKPARDLFTKHFKYGLVNFDLKSTTERDVDVHIECKSVKSNVEAISHITFKPADGVAVKTTVDTNCLISTNLEIKETFQSTKHNIVPSLDCISGLVPITHSYFLLGRRSLKLKASFNVTKLMRNLR